MMGFKEETRWPSWVILVQLGTMVVMGRVNIMEWMWAQTVQTENEVLDLGSNLRVGENNVVHNT